MNEFLDPSGDQFSPEEKDIDRALRPESFDDFAGQDSILENLKVFVAAANQREEALDHTLFHGPPGLGKTTLAYILAGELQAGIKMTSGPVLDKPGDLAGLLTNLQPRDILFIDEIDAVGRARGAGYGGGNDEREQTLNQLLVEMDGFEANEGIIIVAATNRKDVLDPALLRPGRFDRQVTVPSPDLRGREKILGVHARKLPTGPDVDLRIIARGTPGFSGADLANLVNEAALAAARIGRRLVTMEDFEKAKDKILMGAERRSMVRTKEQLAKTAYHEAGHALVGSLLPKCQPVYKATIIARGGAGGMVMSLPEMDRLNFHRDECHDELAMTMAGKAAEIFKYGEDQVSNGPSGDIQQASSLARAMVMRWGMSDKVGNIDYSEAAEGYSGRTSGLSTSAATKELIETEVRSFVQNGYDLAMKTIVDNKERFENLAQGLLEYETLTGAEIKKVMEGESLDRDGDEDDSATSGGTPSVTAVPKTKPKPSSSSGGGMEPEPTA